MTVDSVTLSWRGQEQRRSNGETTRLDIYTVLVSPVSPGEDVRNEILADSSIPQYGAAPEDRDDIFVRDVDARATGPRAWEVIVSYSSIPNPDALSPETPPETPEYEPPSIEWGTYVESSVFDTDVDGQPITNSSTEPFDPPLMRETIEPIIVFTRNYTECTVDIEWMRAFTNVVNSDSIPGFGDRGEVRIVGAPVAVFVRANGPVVAHWRVTFNLLIRRNPTPDSGTESVGPPAYAAHFRRVLDQGTRELRDIDGDDMAIFGTLRTEDGASPLQPFNLNGLGARLEYGAEPVFRWFREFPEVDMSSLGIEWTYCQGTPSDSESE